MQVAVMERQILLLLSFVSSAATKPILGDIEFLVHSDLKKRLTIQELRASPILTGLVAIEIIWACLFAILLTAILFYLRKLRTMVARGPYILLSIGTLLLIVYHGLWAGYSRDNGSVLTYQNNAIMVAANFLFVFGLVSILASVIWVIQQRSSTLPISKGSTIRPITTQFWKRSLDWILVLLFFAIEIAYYGFSVKVNFILLDPSHWSRQETDAKILSLRKLSHVNTALFGLLALDIVVSLVLLYHSGKRVQFRDKAIGFLLFIFAPSIALYLITLVVFDVYDANRSAIIHSPAELYGPNVAWSCIYGACQFSMIFGLLLAMIASAVEDNSNQYGTGTSRDPTSYPQKSEEANEPPYIQHA